MKNKWSAALLSHITAGTIQGNADWVGTTLTHSTKDLQPGQIYVAIKGQKTNGHDYVAEALQKGAVACLVDHVPPGLSPDAPLIIVGNIEQALKDVARYVRHETQAKVFAITGSSGKTTTKDMLYLALKDQVPTHATPASFNSRWGLPLTLSGVAHNDQAIVLEMGMNAPGEILNLTQIGRPHVALITTINPAHIERLGSLDNIAHEKGSIFAGLEFGGTAIIPADVAQRQILVDHATDSAAERIILFGESPLADSRLLSTTAHEDGTMTVTVSLQGREYTYTLGLQGLHFALNSLAVLAAIQAGGFDVEQAMEQLDQFKGAPQRGQVVQLSNGVTLFDESYNANPGSVKAALSTFAARPLKGRKFLALGQMGELGDHAAHYHEDLKEAVLSVQPHHVYLYGNLMGPLEKALRPHVPVTLATTHDQIIQSLKSELKAGDGLLVKGSLSTQMATVVHHIQHQAKNLSGS